jgi:hypothetical protein
VPYRPFLAPDHRSETLPPRRPAAVAMRGGADRLDLLALTIYRWRRQRDLNTVEPALAA